MIRKKLLSAVDPGFIHHAEYTKDLPKRNFTGAKYKGLLFKATKGKTQYAVEFKTNSATFPGEKMHTQRVALLKLRELLQAKEPRPTLMRDKVLKAIAEGDMLIGCSCEAFCIHGETKIRLITGEIKTVAEMKQDFDAGKRLVVYAVNEKGDPVSGEVSSVWISGQVFEMIKITLDNERQVQTTLDHEFMLRDGTYRRAKDLKEGDSLMPLYFYRNKGYEIVRKNSRQQGVSVHNIIAECFLKAEHIAKHRELILSGKEKYLVVHHKDFDEENNNPLNLQWMGDIEHRRYHRNLRDINSRKIIEGTRRFFADPENVRKQHAYRSAVGRRVAAGRSKKDFEKMVRAAKLYLNSSEGKRAVSNKFKETWIRKRAYLIEKIKAYAGRPEVRRAASERLKKRWVENRAVMTRNAWWNKVGAAVPNNHKIVKAELIKYQEPQPVYDISVEGYHNFYVDAGIILHNCYWGYAYICTHMQVVYPDFKENRPPKIRNPLMRGIMCKHLNLVLSVLPFNATNIVSDLKKKELD